MLGYLHISAILSQIFLIFVRSVFLGIKLIMLRFEADKSPGYWIATAAHSMRRALQAELVQQNMTLRQWEVLAWIACDGEQSQAELAEKLGIEAPTLAGVLSRMERDGWLERRGCPFDRRRKKLRATPKAEAVWNQAYECCKKVREQAIQGLSPEDLQNLNRICDTIRNNLSACDSEPDRDDESSTVTIKSSSDQTVESAPAP